LSLSALNKEYIKYKDKHEKHAEVKMISQIGALLSGAGFQLMTSRYRVGMLRRKQTKKQDQKYGGKSNASSRRVAIN
jgi:hypothetical protein